VHEPERRARVQDLRPRQRPARVGHLLLGDLGERRHGREVGALPEHRHGAGHAHGLVRKAREPKQHGARHRPRADVRHHVHVRGVGLHAVRLERGQQLAKQQRVAAGHPRAGSAEALVGVLTQARPHEVGHRGGAERAGPERVRERVVADLRDQRGVGAGVGAAEGCAHERGHVLQPAREVREKP
jgi:hypothetical protein